jgi:hypothetical protein
MNIPSAVLIPILLVLVALFALCLVIIYCQAWRLGYIRGKMDAHAENLPTIKNL